MDLPAGAVSLVRSGRPMLKKTGRRHAFAMCYCVCVYATAVAVAAMTAKGRRVGRSVGGVDIIEHACMF